MPIYGNWKNYTKKDGLPSDKIYCVRVDGKQIMGWNQRRIGTYWKMANGHSFL